MNKEMVNHAADNDESLDQRSRATWKIRSTSLSCYRNRPITFHTMVAPDDQETQIRLDWFSISVREGVTRDDETSSRFP